MFIYNPIKGLEEEHDDCTICTCMPICILIVVQTIITYDKSILDPHQLSSLRFALGCWGGVRLDAATGWGSQMLTLEVSWDCRCTFAFLSFTARRQPLPATALWSSINIHRLCKIGWIWGGFGQGFLLEPKLVSLIGLVMMIYMHDLDIEALLHQEARSTTGG